ncbi:MAG: hypothetical protein NC084_06605 [Bacteroides sp.]|nr:hypothetical protein [Eubacterium sp.]MCM1418249.1 hypothetical protein [Roseburia sp.]MCM1462369.1 hypothetical protein [Bacteroides sp.]
MHTDNEPVNRKKAIAALICGMLGCIFLCSGDWLMIYGDTAHGGDVHWLTEGTAQIPAWRNLLSMLVAFPAVILYGVGLFNAEVFVKPQKEKRIYRVLTAFGMMPWLCLHIYYVMILYAFAFMTQNDLDGALIVAEAMNAQFSSIVFISEAIMIIPFLYWFYLQISGKTLFPKRMAFTNILIIYGVLQIVKALLPDTPFRLGFTNGLMSESMFIWFGIMLVWSVKRLPQKGETI